MNWYVYKCNSLNLAHQRQYGNWREFFDGSWTGEPASWGTTKWIPALAELQEDDKVLAYQTNENSLVGLVEVDGWREEGGWDYVYLRPLIRLGTDGVKVRPMKIHNRRIAEIHAFKTRQIKTLYHISPEDADLILAEAKTRCVAIEFNTQRPKRIPRKRTGSKLARN